MTSTDKIEHSASMEQLPGEVDTGQNMKMANRQHHKRRQTLATPVQLFTPPYQPDMEKYYPTLGSKDSRYDTPPGVTDPSEEEVEEKVLWNFAMETTAHGVGKVAAAKSTAKRGFWIVALLGAFSLSVGMISLRFEAYFSYSTVVEVNTIFPDNLTFPAVTFCNFNKVRLSYLRTGDNAKIFNILNNMLSEQFSGTEENICSCASTEFQCVAADAAGNQTCCIPSEWTCDNSVDCFDGSDEADICAASALNGVFTMRPMISGDVYLICSSTISTTLPSSGWITSEAFGTGLYQNNLRCAIDLPHHGYRYIIAAIYAKIEYHSVCNFDYLMIGSVRICGTYEKVVAIDVDTLKEGFSVRILFFADGSVNDLGFAIDYQYSDTDNGLEVLTSESETSAAEYDPGDYFDERFLAYQNVSETIPLCAPEMARYPVLASGNYTNFGTWILISHPGYTNGSSEDYPIGVRCTVSFFPVDGCHISMRFLELALDGEYPWNCTTDYILLEYESVSGEIVTQKFCGLTSQTVNITDLGPEEDMNVTFITSEYADASNRIGFSLMVYGTNDTYDGDDDGGDSDGDGDDNSSEETLSGIFSTQPMITGEVYLICSDLSDVIFPDAGWITTAAEFGSDTYSTNLQCLTGLPHRGHNFIIMSVYAKIEDHLRCAYDYLIVGPEKICGIYERTFALNISGMINGSVIPVEFHSDDTENDIGFALEYRYSDSDEGEEVISYTQSLTIIDTTTDDYTDSSTSDYTTESFETTEETQLWLTTTETPNTAGKRRKRAAPFNIYNIIRQRRSTNSSTKDSSTATVLDIAGTQFSARIIEGGWKLNDSLLQCEFRGHTCDGSWFDQTLTRFGNCYTFNQENLLTADIVRPLGVPLTQLQPGPAHGLNIKLDVHREEYAESLDTGYAEVGIKFQVHSKSSAPDVENQGLAVGTGRKVYAGFYGTKVQNIEPPWGRCNKSMILEFSDIYSYQQCAVECKLNYAVRECGCKPYYYPGDIKECTAFELKNCALSAIARLDQGEFSSECNCPVACKYELIDLKTSYVEFGSIPSIIDEMNREYYKINDSSRNPRNDSDFYKNNIISFSLYYNDLSYREMRQLKAMDESSLLSDLGGQLGLFIGVSVLTICEMFEAMWLAMTKCMKRRKVRRITEKWMANVQAAQEQLRT